MAVFGFCALQWALALWLEAAVGVVADDTPVTLDRKSGRDLEAAVRELARAGLREEFEELLSLLEQTDYPADDRAALRKAGEKDLGKARPAETATRRARGKLGQAVTSLGTLLDAAPEEAREPVARLVRRLDAENARANETLGWVEHEGRWQTAEQIATGQRRAAIQAALAQARRLEVEVVTEPYQHPLFAALGIDCHVVRRGEFEYLSDQPPARMERIFRESLRALAFSNYLRRGSVALPEKVSNSENRQVVLTGRARFLEALAYAREQQWLKAAALAEAERTESFEHPQGTRFSYTTTEVEAYLTLVHTLAWWWRWREHPGNVQPCLSVGHLSWVCLSYFGLESVMVHRYEPDPDANAPRTLSAGESETRAELELLGEAGISGARMWLQYLADRHEDAQWEAAMRLQMGDVIGRAKLKTTFVVDYLQELGRFPELVEKTVLPLSEQQQKPNLRAQFETALGCTLEEFEERWRRWFLPEEQGLIQQLGTAHEASFDAPSGAALADLNALRHEALSTGTFPDSRSVKLDAELCAGCRAHALYLDLHPEQLATWPDAHEEYPDQERFSPAGSRAGMHGVIAPGSRSATDAIDAWMATYYHRLPLLDPGLLRIGFGLEAEIAVLDCASLVRPTRYLGTVQWPPAGARDVPLRFSPELPNPVPGEDQAEWGYPITLQTFGLDEQIEMTLHAGDTAGAPVVQCHFTSPATPLNQDLVPPGSFCLIPRNALRAKTTYTATATSPTGFSKTWSFTTGS